MRHVRLAVIPVLALVALATPARAEEPMAPYDPNAWYTPAEGTSRAIEVAEEHFPHLSGLYGLEYRTVSNLPGAVSTDVQKLVESETYWRDADNRCWAQASWKIEARQVTRFDTVRRAVLSISAGQWNAQTQLHISMIEHFCDELGTLIPGNVDQSMPQFLAGWAGQSAEAIGQLTVDALGYAAGFIGVLGTMWDAYQAGELINAAQAMADEIDAALANINSIRDAEGREVFRWNERGSRWEYKWITLESATEEAREVECGAWFMARKVGQKLTYVLEESMLTPDAGELEGDSAKVPSARADR